MAGAAPLKLGGISLGGDQTTRTWSTTMFEWSYDDEVPVTPPPSTKAPPRSMRVEEQSMEGEEVPQQQAMGAPEQKAKGVPEQQTRGVPERWVEGFPEQ